MKIQNLKDEDMIMENLVGSFTKYATPVFGGPETGTMFDAYVRKQADG